MSKAALETAIRNDVLTTITTALSAAYDTDILATGVGEVAIPVVDAEGNEAFAVIKITIPRGTRSGGTYQPYDGYAAAEDYKMVLEDQAAKKAAREAKAAALEKEKERKRAAKRVKKGEE